ncbi:MAG: hypothetical protein IMF11_07495 [Proteobacteria bacterium]|nr:hypothetical protein [Pseudomonadota bacterium]
MPLVLMLPFWPRKDLDKRKSEYIPVIRERLSYFLPFVVVAGLYSLYRRWMLGHWLGEYGGLYPAQTDIATLLNNTGHLMLGDAAWLATIILPFVLLGLWSSRFGKFKNICFAFLVLLLVAGPLVPLMKISGVLTERHFFLPAFILSIAVSLGGSLLWRLGQAGRFAGLVGIAVIFLGLFQANQGVQKELGDLSHKYSSVGRFLWSESDACDALFVESIPGWYFKGLSWLRNHVEHREEMARPIIDICYFIYTNASTLHWRRFWRYDHDKKRIIRMDSEVVSTKCQKCLDAYRSDVSLDIRVWQDEGLIRWELGPY